MSVRVEVKAEPQLKTQLTHMPSRTQLVTEAPVDNGGTGASFSPTDLVGAALVSCMITSMEIVGRKEGIDIALARGSVEKNMTATPPRRIGELNIEIKMPRGLSPAHRARLEEIARGCPVRRSLHPDVKVSERFIYAD